MLKRILTLAVVVLVVAGLFRFCNSKPEKKGETEQKQVPLALGEKSTVFNQSFHALLSAYYSLKDAFVAGDIARVDLAAGELGVAASELKTDEIRGDSTGMIKETALHFTQSISSAAGNLVQKNNIEEKRREFENLTDDVWSLTRTVQYEGEKVYYQFCPMAFNNKGAYWLSNSREILNPYFGDKMLKCGELTDSLDYSRK